MGGISDEPVKAWESRIKWFLETCHLKDLDRVDGKSMVFDWRMFAGFTTLGILDEIQNMMTESECEPEQSKGRIIFMSMCNDIDGGKRGNKPIPPGQQVRQRLDQQQFEGLPQDGDTILLPRRIRLRHHHGNQAATGSRFGAGVANIILD